MKSSNGTLLNGVRIFEPEILKNQDILTFGDHQYSFVRGEEKDD